jgi:serine/threonine-protein kinase
MIGRIVGNYKIAEKIGEGGMGSVYRAVDLMLERDVALKAIRPELSREPQIAERFRSEARALARVSHPAIANVYTFFYEEDELFLAMEYVRGRTLSRVLQDEGALPWRRAVPMIASAMEGIEQAHRTGIVHRDLKPDNLMLTEAGTLKVMDFGIARVMGSVHLTRTGLLVGTLRYMAPEQIRGEEVDGRTDVYALGAVLYEMLTGRPPFEGSTDWAILRAQIEDVPRPPGEHVPQLPWWLDRAVLRALAKQPAERFPSVEEMRLCLLRQGETMEAPRPLEDLPTLVTPPGTRTPPPPPPPPHAAPTLSLPPASATPPPPVFPPIPPTPALAAMAASPSIPTAQTPTSYRPVELSAKGGSGRKLLIAAVALCAFVGIAVIVLLALSSLLGEPPAGDTADSTTTAVAAAPDGGATPAVLSEGTDETEETEAPAPSTEPAAEPRIVPPSRPVPRSVAPADQEMDPIPQSVAEPERKEPPEPPVSTYATPEPPVPETASPSGLPPLEEIRALAGEIEAKSALLVDAYGDFQGRKEDSGVELTAKDEQLKDDLDGLLESAEAFNKQFQVGFLGRIRGRRADDRKRIGDRYRDLAHRAAEVDGLMAEVHADAELRQAWQEVRSRWKRVAGIVAGF